MGCTKTVEQRPQGSYTRLNNASKKIKAAKSDQKYADTCCFSQVHKRSQLFQELIPDVYFEYRFRTIYLLYIGERLLCQ